VLGWRPRHQWRDALPFPAMDDGGALTVPEHHKGIH
jgi:hypothetical protein